MERWYFPLIRVAQKDNHGCGIAAVATVCGLTYVRARAEFFPKRQSFKDDKRLHVDLKTSAAVIRRLGFETEEIDNPVSFDCPTIFTFCWDVNSRLKDYHTVVWNPFDLKVIDPGHDHTRGLTNEYYFSLWKKSGFRPLAITRRIAVAA